MMEIMKTVDGQIVKQTEITDDCWISLNKPTQKEISQVSEQLNVEKDFLTAALDDEETSRIDTEDGHTLIIMDIPYISENDGLIIYETLPLAVVLTEKNIITICLKENNITKDFSESKIKNVYTNMKTRFLLQVLYRVATKYLFYLRQIDKRSAMVEKELHKSMKNKELIQLLDLEKSLVFFSTSLKANEVTLEKILRGRYVKLYEDDKDLLEDVLIEIKQAIEMSNIYSNILSGTMDAFASIISNNLNIVMKVLTSITIIMAIPTMIASFFGMNMEALPITNFWIVIIVSGILTLVTGVLLYFKKLL